jgi:hypothetical protein
MGVIRLLCAEFESLKLLSQASAVGTLLPITFLVPGRQLTAPKQSFNRPE